MIQSLILVGLGGSFGAAAREGLVLAIPNDGGVPWAILLANIVGALILGLLLSTLTRHASHDLSPAPPRRGAILPRRRSLQLLLGTGFCGGFTTYSTLAVGFVSLSGTASQGPSVAVAYGLGTVVLGGVATWLGMAWGSRS
ncbi:hypothetical protein CVS30_09505 [Arthrobacter psychrolactophilus]|uniref:Fluoride-specific ion channel FluC n=1 Tax=Arthrobacter psychrolactophilus TaxID=92442 RepID=A0A2V5IPV5_9MICC|nr:hypothetical protein CVS30_09505 [Arthrobacter psychrolactophilus]